MSRFAVPHAQTYSLSILTCPQSKHRHRLLDAFGDAVQYEVKGEPVSVPDAQALADTKPYQFQWWALGLVGARPVEQKKGADKGIDGRLYFHDEEDKRGKTKQVVLSVKAGMPRAVLSVGDGARLSLYDTAGKERALLKTVKGDPRYNMGEDMPMLVLFDDKGWPDIVLGTMRLELPNRQSIMNPKPSLLFFGGGINTSNVIWRAP